MQDKQWHSISRIKNPLIKIGFLPRFKLLRLIQREICLHGKIGFWQVKRLFEFEWFGHGCRDSQFPSGPLVFACSLAGNIGKWCNYVCYNEWSMVSARAGVQPILPGENRTGIGARYVAIASN